MKLILLILFTALMSSHLQNTENNCEIVFDGIDLSSKLYRKEIVPQKLFYFTPDEIKNNIQQGNLIEAFGQMMRVEDNYYLNLNLSLYSKKASEQYGSIDKGSSLHVKMINGQSYKIPCRAGSYGQKVNFQKNYIYPVSYSIDKSLSKKLTKSEIDKIGIEWSSGYEEYVIYELDFFINQIACLNR